MKRLSAYKYLTAWWRNLPRRGKSRLHGPLVYFAACKNHIGFYPPVKGDERLMRAIAPYANERGNLRFPLDQPIPYALIGRIVKARIHNNAERVATPKQKANRKVSRAS